MYMFTRSKCDMIYMQFRRAQSNPIAPEINRLTTKLLTIAALVNSLAASVKLTYASVKALFGIILGTLI